MKLLLLNDHYFGNAFRDLGADVLRAGVGDDQDLQLDPERDNLVQKLAEAGFRPDAVLQVDTIDRRIFFRGLNELHVPTAFYAVDAPINGFWQQPLAHGFDWVWLDQKEVAEHWQKAGLSWSSWLPLAADASIFHPPAGPGGRETDVLFVGSLDPKHRPKRQAVINRLKRVAQVRVLDGEGRRSIPPEEVAREYRGAKLVLNELLFDGVNLRTFEAAACGAVVLTEDDRGAEMVFRDGTTVATFSPKTLESVVHNLLRDPDYLADMGERAAELVMGAHTLTHRARTVLRRLDRLKVRPGRNRPEARAWAAFGRWSASLKWQDLAASRRDAVRELNDLAEHLPLRKRLAYTALEHGVERALDEAGRSEEELRHDAVSRVRLAQIALEGGDLTSVGSLLDEPVPNGAAAHMALGRRLEHLGIDMTPGFNRTPLPMLFWNASEHYQRTMQLDGDNREAVEGLDRILVAHRAAEFTVPIWQRWHATHPRDTQAMRTMVDRAELGYFRFHEPDEAGEEAVRPFSSSSQGAPGRMRYSIRNTRDIR